MLAYETSAWAEGYTQVAGIDEAGRGPLAGPVVAAAVIFDPDFVRAEQHQALRKLTDSKKITASVRDLFFELLTQSPHVRYGVGRIEAPDIDALNILRATHQAMAQACEMLDPLPELALVDGRPVKGLPCPHRAIVKGDAQSLSIAAASVIAKVTRDRLMDDWDRAHPEYGFAQHKGYGTRAHLEALKQHGACPCHRLTFAPVRAVVDVNRDWWG